MFLWCHKITVRQLLQHCGGWDRDQSIDPMFQSIQIARALDVPPPARPEHIIQFMLGWPLDFDPGSRYAYSNFGYCLLGRLIEHHSGLTYEQHVGTRLLRPLGIHSMRIGATAAEKRIEKEVCYYTRNDRNGFCVLEQGLGCKVPLPYGAWYLEAMDAHGGWVASAIDLMRFASAIQHDRPCALLSAEMQQAMVARPKGVAEQFDNEDEETYYGLGWMIRQVEEGKHNLWHTGSLDGTSTILVLRHDGLAWAVLFNTRDMPDGEHPARHIDPLVHEAVDAVSDWPTHNLFELATE